MLGCEEQCTLNNRDLNETRESEHRSGLNELYADGTDIEIAPNTKLKVTAGLHKNDISK